MGVPLPFVSSGGSSLIVSMMAAGMLLNVPASALMPAIRPCRSGPAPGLACIAAGGTGGHVLPGSPWRRRWWPGATTLHPSCSSAARVASRPRSCRAGFALATLPGRGIERRVSLAAVKAVLSIIAGVVQGIRLVRRRRPQVIVLLGGYAAVPCIVAGVLWRVPMVAVARDARGGAADRWAARVAAVTAVPFDAADLPARRAVVTGNPVRAEVLAIDRDRDRDRARAALDLPADRLVIAVFTGSLGSRRVNEAVRGLVERWADRRDLAIRHVIGTRDWEQYAANLPVPPAGGLVYQAIAYEHDMDLLLAAADIVVSRAGGATIAELRRRSAAVLTAALTTPTADGERRALVRVGGGIRVPDAELDTDRLERELRPLVEDPDRRRAMGEQARTIARPDAAASVADLVEETARRA
jgi:UDP-N-acetylglucosamine:LPS N-acetylglucosamine transferase